MDDANFPSYIFPALFLSVFFLWTITRVLRTPAGNNNQPPSPRKLPILGNLHQLSSLPHQDLHLLAKKHGPLMLLHYGCVPVLVVSSAETARDVMRTHDVAFADRPMSRVARKCFYDCTDVAFMPYGEPWRQAKGHFVLRLLSNKKVQSSRSIREEETALFLKKIRESPGPVSLTRMFSEFSNDGIFRSAFGRKFSEMDDGEKFPALVMGLSEVLGAIDIGEYIPWLSWISRVNGLDAKVKIVARGLDEFMEGVIEERLRVRKEKGSKGADGENFIDILLDFNDDNTTADADDTNEGGNPVPMDRVGIKGIILDAFAAGTETTPIALEWAMAELLRHPAVMEKLQREVRDIVKDRDDITDDDLGKMHYLKAVIKETFRLHPPFPMLLPRIARENVKLNGYDIRSGTMVVINAWAIGRDPASWDEPEKFKPERFFDSSVDFKGLDFELIPFGAGRRKCPAAAYATALVELLLANLVHKFNWKLPQETELDMTERPGITTHRAVPLLAVATKIA